MGYSSGILDRSQPMSGYLTGRKLAMAEEQNQMAQMQGILAIQGALENQQLAPLRRQMLEAQIADAKRKSEFQSVLRGVLSGDSGGVPGATGGSTAVRRDPQGNVMQGGISTPGTPVQGASRGIEQALADPRFALAAKLNGLDVSEMFKFYNTPQKFEGGSLYRDPATGTEKYQPKYGEGVQPGPGGTAQNIPGFVRASTEQEQGKLDPKMEKFMVNGKEYIMSNADYRVLTGPAASEQDAINQMMVAERYGIPWSASPAARPQPAPAPQPQPQPAPVVQPLPRASDGVPGNYSPAQARPSAGIPTPSAGIPTSRVVGNSFAAPSPAEKVTAEGTARTSVDRVAAQPQALKSVNTQIGDLDRLSKLATEISGNPDLGRATGLAGALPSVPAISNVWEGGAASVDALVNSLKAQISGMKLQSMRDASKTGGAVGQVTEREWPRLENMIVALDQVKMNKQMFQSKLGELVTEINKSKANIQQAYESEYGKMPSNQSYPAPSRDAINRLKMRPSEKAQFEAVFGPGSAEQYGGK